jgi:ribosomal protein S18 acetylase RimI-like enzyme
MPPTIEQRTRKELILDRSGQSGRTFCLLPGLSRFPEHKENTMVEIRAFEDVDEAAVTSLWTRVFGYSTPHNQPATVIRQKLAFQRELFFVAVSENAVVGTVMGGYDGHRGWIYSLAVAPEFRGRSIGSALMRHVEKALMDRGCAKINLQLLATNAATAAFYEKLGYRVEERISMGKLL